jgi:hypothetical protein
VVEDAVTALTVLFFTLVALRLVVLVLQVMVVRESAARRRNRPPFDPCLGPFAAGCPPPVPDEGRVVALPRSGRFSRER